MMMGNKSQGMMDVKTGRRIGAGAFGAKKHVGVTAFDGKYHVLGVERPSRGIPSPRELLEIMRRVDAEKKRSEDLKKNPGPQIVKVLDKPKKQNLVRRIVSAFQRRSAQRGA